MTLTPGTRLPERVLVTGGAGFIGAHLAAELLAAGCAVRVLDNLDPQVHAERQRPRYLSNEAEFVFGDVRSPDTVREALKGVDAVCHLAAAVGVGQSMYEIERYTAINDLGTAVLLEAMTASDVRRLLVASSMSIYGEGLVRGPAGLCDPPERSLDQLKAGRWELETDRGEPLEPVPTPESKAPVLGSIYALNKYNQERMCLIFGRAYGVGVVATRFFNVYGPHQALSNPYTGVLAIFAARLLNGKPPLVFEDGMQRRDFVHVRDVARACRLALETPAATGQVVNIGSGRSRTILDVAQLLAEATGRHDIAPECTGRYRVGDIRHCFADISLARRLLDFEPRVSFGDGLVELAEWLSTQVAVDRVDQATDELARRGLVV
ncbi:MAG TPA: SDR family NAD(P)-dependent oxidoreductase [Stellaceae bacterium]|jgi:dTDP-L-rhamnose 4-epimerase|nr:SDR family NAD(P)-dependent oxidoreductase [Stellaceae bacterium]